ncbi:MAG TPA: SDR family NAD(P)-dependent oxidoreductase, partial [Phycisphaerae bacterium]
MQSTFEITQEMVDRFVEFTGDRNAQHTDEQFARRFRFRRRVVHGMLPFSHLLLVGREHPGQRLDLKETETQFLKPAFVGDRIQIDVQMTTEGALRRYEASWHNVRTGEVLIKSTGVLRLVDAAAIRSADAGHCVLLTPLDENLLTMDELSGRAQAFSFKITAGQAQWYEREILKLEERSAGPSTLAALLLSTMVGMRLPGRYATFVSFQLGFEQPLDFSVPCTLHARVEKLSPATESLSLNVSIKREDTTVASGKITSLVSPPPRALVTCAQIRQQHLDLGLRDKVALVTGSSRGIGATTAKLLAMHGCKVAINYFRGQADAEEVAADINSSGGTAVAIGCDVADEAQVRRLFEQVTQQFGGLEILVNNAVRDAQPKSTEELQWADYLAELEVSLKGTILCCRQALPIFRQRKGGKIVNLST